MRFLFFISLFYYCSFFYALCLQPDTAKEWLTADVYSWRRRMCDKVSAVHYNTSHYCNRHWLCYCGVDRVCHCVAYLPMYHR